MGKKLIITDTISFIEKANLIHNNQFTYEKSIYTKSQHKIIITCNIHGDYSMKANNHISGEQGCPECGKLTRAETQSIKLEDFLIRSKQIHGDHYRYDENLIIKNTRTKIRIWCNKCNEYFSQSVLNHLQGNGCPRCAGQILTYNDIKQYIEVESKSGCTLLTSEDDLNYIKENGVPYSLAKLKIECTCSNIFYKKYGNFKFRKQQQCPECGDNKQRLSQVMNIELIQSIISKGGYKWISGEYLNNISYLTLEDRQGYILYTAYANIKDGSPPHIFSTSNPYTIKNIHTWCKIHNKPYLLMSDIYLGNTNKLLWKCLKDSCGDIFELEWGNINAGKGCGVCHGKQVGISNCLATKRPDIASEWHPTLNDKLTPYEVSYGSSIYVWWQCSNCNHEWETSVSNRSSKGICPNCNMSSGEKYIHHNLLKNGIINKSEYKFNDLIGVGGGCLRFDFAIFDLYNNLKLLCEFDGEQHTRWFEGWITKKQFENLQYHDKLKNEYCELHNIPLLRINYDQFDNIEEILIKELSKYNLIDTCTPSQEAV